LHVNVVHAVAYTDCLLNIHFSFLDLFFDLTRSVEAHPGPVENCDDIIYSCGGGDLVKYLPGKDLGPREKKREKRD
jgi:hypothetical protein